MPRPKNAVKDLAETHRYSMQKCPVFELWVRRHLRSKDRIEDYKKAYELVHKPEDNDETTA